jgi:hypothetical protein
VVIVMHLSLNGSGTEALDTIPNTYISPSPLHGRGLFSSRELPSGMVLCVLDGQIVRHEQCIDLLFEYEWNALDCDHLLVRPIRTKFGFINHAVNRNCAISGSGRVLRVLRNIAKGDELTLNYLEQSLPAAYLEDDRSSYLRAKTPQ